MKNRFLWLFLILFYVQSFGRNAYGQVYTTTGNSTDWNSPAAWVRTNPTGCAAQNGGPPPPRTLNPGNACPVKIIINHPITFTGNSSIGGGFMDSLIVNTGGNLTFTGSLDVTTNEFQPSVGAFSFTVRGGGILRVNGNLTNQNGTSIRIQNAAQFSIGGNYTTTGTSSSLNVDATSSLTMAGSTTINSAHSLSVTGNFATNTLSTGGGGTIVFNGASTISVSNTLSHINGSITMSSTSNLFVGGNLDMNGSAILTLSGDTDIKVLGNLNQSNGAIHNAGNGDIRIDGNITMSGGGIYDGRDNSHIQANGNHIINSYNPVNLSSNAKFVALGAQTGGWGGASLSGNSCYTSTNRPNSLCLPCHTPYTANSSFYVPAGVTQLTLELVGGGGRGGNRTSNGRAGGGGGGAYSRIIVAVTPGETLGVFVGSGGNQTNANGGTSYVTRDPSLPIETGSIVFARGGNAGADAGTGGIGGARDSRTISFAGGNGANASNSGTVGSGGGGSAGGSNGIGNNGGILAGGVDPSGIGGPGGAGTDADANGLAPAAGFGGGGGGARRNSLLFTREGGAGASGHVIISYSCPVNTPCSRFLNFGTSSGLTVIEYLCSGVWNAPEGLAEFSVTSIGGGGGGGFGSSAGGGGGGAVVSQTFSNINQQPASPPSRPSAVSYGLPANTNFNVTVGNGGNGATSAARSTNGGFSGFSGNFVNYANTTVNFTSVASGGGGGGSSLAAFRNGLTGGSGGGAARQGSTSGTGGLRGATGLTNAGANGRISNATVQGGGGGGAGSAGQEGTSSPFGIVSSTGGNGGNGALISVPNIRVAGGGGGTSSGGAINTPGSGGSGGGGNGSNSGVGFAGTANTGSGGGAGLDGGGNGGSGSVYISYANFRILPVDYLYFKAKYNSGFRTGDLTWATAKEWENSHFEIERSVNDVKVWKTIGHVTGAGYSDTPAEYAYQDAKLPLAGGNIFYRLKQLDFDGDSAYSDTKSIRVEPMPGLSYWRVYPNPTTGTPINLELLDNGIYHDELVTVRIISPTGQYDVIESKVGSYLNALVSDHLTTKAAGIYTFEISWGRYREYHKVILMR